MDRDFDEEGEPIFDPDAQSDREPSVDADEENWEQEYSAGAGSEEDDAPKPKSRRRLKKKTTEPSQDEDAALDDDEDGGGGGASRDIDDDLSDEEEPRKRARKEKGSSKEGKGGGKGKQKSGMSDKPARLAKGSSSSSKKGSSEKLSSRAPSSSQGSKRGDKEMKEMWDSVAGAESEEDIEGVRTKDDEAFIDDTGVDPEDRVVYSDDEAGSIGDAPQAEEREEEDDLKSMFKSGKSKNKKVERTAEETAMLVEQFMARLEVAAEEDAELNRQSKPAINKLKMLPSLINVLSKRQLQQEFLDRGVLSVLKNWLEPLPDGSLPNMTIRSALLKLLTDLPIDVELYERREQLKKSGLGKVIMFLSKSDEEGVANRKLARDLVDKWSRPIFQKSTRYEDLRGYDDERPPPPRPPVKKPMLKSPAGFDSRGGDDLDLVDNSQDLRPGQPGYRIHASRPEALPLDFVVRPLSKVDPEEVRARAKQQRLDERRMKMNKKLQQLKAPKKKMQATKLSVEGRGMVKFF